MSNVVVTSSSQSILVDQAASSVAVVTGGTGGGGSDGYSYRQDTAPTVGLVEGQTWFDTSTGNEFVRYDSAWVMTGPGNGQGIGNGIVAKSSDLTTNTSVGTGTWTDITGSTVSFTAKAGRTYRVSYSGYLNSNHGTANTAYLGLYTAANVQITALVSNLAGNPGPGDEALVSGSYVGSFTPGIVSLKLRAWFIAGTGNLAGGLSATAPCQMVVEDITPSSGGDSIYPTPWTNVTYENSWVDYSASTPVQYRMVGDSVELRGRCKNGTLGATVFTFPVGFRPAYIVNQMIMGASYSTPGSISIPDTGLVTVACGSNVEINLGTIRFSTRTV